jgi:hypothetical protein
MTSVPTTWPELRVRFQAPNEEELRLLVPSTIELIEGRVAQTPIGAGLLGLDEITTRLAILVGPASCPPIFAGLAPYYAPALDDAQRGGTPGAGPLLQLMLVSYGNVGRCIGDPHPDEAIERAILELAVKGKRFLEEPAQQALAAACVAVGLPARALALLGHGKPAAFKAGEQFDSNVSGLIAYLCAAVKAGATERDVVPAWEALHAAFPRKLSATTIRWSTLLWVARVVFGGIGGRPHGEIAGRVHELSARG